MNTTIFTGLAILIGAPGLKDPPAKPPTIEGEWTVESSLMGGKDDGLLAKSPIDKIIITVDRWTVVRGGDNSAGTNIAIDMKKDPPHLDIGFSMSGAGCRGVFKLEGDTLTVCYNLGGALSDRQRSSRRSIHKSG